MPKRRSRSSTPRITACSATQTKTSNGSSETDAKAVAVMPCTRPGARSAVTTVTPVAKWPRAWRNSMEVRGTVAIGGRGEDITVQENAASGDERPLADRRSLSPPCLLREPSVGQKPPCQRPLLAKRLHDRGRHAHFVPALPAPDSRAAQPRAAYRLCCLSSSETAESEPAFEGRQTAQPIGGARLRGAGIGSGQGRNEVRVAPAVMKTLGQKRALARRLLADARLAQKARWREASAVR